MPNVRVSWPPPTNRVANRDKREARIGGRARRQPEFDY